MSTTRHSREFWKSTCEKFKKSGQSREAFARAHGLNPTTLKWWIAVFKRESQSAAPVTRFLPVEIAPAPLRREGQDRAGVFEVLLAGGATVRIPVLAEASRVRDLLRAVVEAGC